MHILIHIKVFVRSCRVAAPRELVDASSAIAKNQSEPPCAHENHCDFAQNPSSHTDARRGAQPVQPAVNRNY